ncbi:ABC1 kinase family protein [Pradoshia sp.]
MLNKRIRHFNRYQDIIRAMIHHGFGSIAEELGLADMLPFGGKWIFEGKDVKGKPAGERIRLILEELGPTYIKLGQMMSTRPDIIPAAIIFELEKLQDKVKEISFDEVKVIIEDELELPLEELFTEFNPVPIAAASIGQVHKAALPSGDVVAVKVQRPNITKTIDTDLEILHNLARMVEKRYKWAKNYGISDIVDEFSLSLNMELDYGVEGRNAEKIAAQFKEDDTIRVPAVYWDYSTKRVLTMEYVEGIKINDVKSLDELGFDRCLLSERFTEAMMKQILLEGLFHADPHPGNIFVQPGDRLVFLDFGNIGRISTQMKYEFASMLMALRRGSTDFVVRSILKIGVTPDDINHNQFRADVQEFIDNYYGKNLNSISISDLINDFFTLTYLHHIRIPSDLTMLGKAFLSVEGVVETLYPEYNILDIIEPFGDRLVKERFKPKNIAETVFNKVADYTDFFSEMPTSLKDLTSKLKDGKFSVQIKVPQLETFLAKMDKMANQLSYAIILLSFSIIMAGLVIGSSSRGGTNILFQIPIIEIGFVIATVMVLYLLYSIFRSGRF